MKKVKRLNRNQIKYKIRELYPMINILMVVWAFCFLYGSWMFMYNSIKDSFIYLMIGSIVFTFNLYLGIMVKLDMVKVEVMEHGKKRKPYI